MDSDRLGYVYEGWDGYNKSLISAIQTLTFEQFAFRASEEMRSVGELAWHIADGRVDWFRRINAPGHSQLQETIEARNGKPPESYTAEDLVTWFEQTWSMVEATLSQWRVEDLPITFKHSYQGTVFAVSRQWVIWRIMCHDIHHGGQLSELLGMQGVFPLELTLLGGHLTVPATTEA